MAVSVPKIQESASRSVLSVLKVRDWRAGMAFSELKEVVRWSGWMLAGSKALDRRRGMGVSVPKDPSGLAGMRLAVLHAAAGCFAQPPGR